MYPLHDIIQRFKALRVCGIAQVIAVRTATVEKTLWFRAACKAT